MLLIKTARNPINPKFVVEEEVEMRNENSFCSGGLYKDLKKLCKGFIDDDRASQDSEGRIEGSKLYKSPQLLLQSESRVQFEDATDPNCLKSNQSRIRRSFAEILAAFHFNPPLIFIDVVLSVVGEHCSSNLCLLSIENSPWVSVFNQCPLC